MALGQLLDQKWVRRIGRVALILLATFAGSGVTYFFTLGHRIDLIETDRARRISQTDAKLADLNSGLFGLRNDVAQLKVDIGVVKGILQDMQRQDDVAALRRRLTPSWSQDPASP